MVALMSATPVFPVPRHGGKRGRGAAGKAPVFGLLKRGGKVYTVIIPNAKASTLIPIIREKVKPDSVVYTDSFIAYDVLDVSEFPHRRVKHSKTFVTKRGAHINPRLRGERLIENFWLDAQASRPSVTCAALMASQKTAFMEC